ncbi:unnamed protein product [Rhizopus stolonifer]
MKRFCCWNEFDRSVYYVKASPQSTNIEQRDLVFIVDQEHTVQNITSKKLYESTIIKDWIILFFEPLFKNNKKLKTFGAEADALNEVWQEAAASPAESAGEFRGNPHYLVLALGVEPSCWDEDS